MVDDVISVIDFATEIGRRKSTVFKVLAKLGIEPTKRRSSLNAGQFVSCITLAQSKLVLERLVSSSGNKADGETGPLTIDESENGVFYLIALEPDHDPGRFKVGFAVNLSERLRQHRCAAPFASVVASWSCKRLWEKTAIDCVASGCERLHTEVFRTNSLANVVERCNAFFALMPSTSSLEPSNMEAGA